LKLKWPHLFSFAKNGSISIKEALASPHIPDLFHLPISEEALVQLNLFQALLQDLTPHAGNDSWTMLGNSSLQVSKVYKKLMDDVGAMSALDWMWKGCCQQKHKVFFWLLIHNRLNTRALLQRKSFLMDDYSCIMCNQNTWKQGIICSFSALLQFCVGNISVLSGPPCSWSAGSPGSVVQSKASHIQAIFHGNHHAGHIVYLDHT
jgi:hypothetical protein